MNQTTEQKKSFASPRQYAICATFLAIILFVVSGLLLSDLFEHSIGEHLGILLGGCAGLVFYLIQERSLHLKEQIRRFDVTIPLMILLLNWTACGLASSLYGMIACRFSNTVLHVPGDQSLPYWIGAVVAAPIGEELMFRLCSMGLLKKCSGKLFTILFPTIVFALMHGFYNVQGVIDVFSGSIFFAICYYYTENLLYTILAHLLHNLLCIPDLSFTEHTVNGYSILNTPFFIAYLVLFAAGIIWMATVFRKKYSAENAVRSSDKDLVHEAK